MTTGSGARPKTGWAKLVPELLVSDIAVSLEFWRDRLGFAIAYQRPAEAFAYLERPEGAQIMLSQRSGKWKTAPLDRPYGRGAMFQVYVASIGPVQHSLEAAGWPLYAGPREVRRDVGDRQAGQREFFVLDPDGLVMVADDLGEQPLSRGGRGVGESIEIREAEPGDARAIADIHLAARREAMPYLHRAHTDDETRDYFGRVVGDRRAAWWVARAEHEVVAYKLVGGENLDHLYVRPGWQRRGVGLSLLIKAKALSPRRLELWTFQRNANARAFYQSQGFRVVECTDGRNEENEPDVKYEWEPAR